MTDSLNEILVGLIDSVLEKVEKPLVGKKPNVKSALKEINRIRTICHIIRTETDQSKSNVENKSKQSIQRHTYSCLYQCGFKTTSIREIDNHLTNVHGHPDPKRDYNHPIYNEP